MKYDDRNINRGNGFSQDNRESMNSEFNNSVDNARNPNGFFAQKSGVMREPVSNLMNRVSYPERRKSNRSFSSREESAHFSRGDKRNSISKGDNENSEGHDRVERGNERSNSRTDSGLGSSLNRRGRNSSSSSRSSRFSYGDTSYTNQAEEFPEDRNNRGDIRSSKDNVKKEESFHHSKNESNEYSSKSKKGKSSRNVPSYNDLFEDLEKGINSNKSRISSISQKYESYKKLKPSSYSSTSHDSENYDKYRTVSKRLKEEKAKKESGMAHIKNVEKKGFFKKVFSRKSKS